MTTLVSDGMATWWNRPLWTRLGSYLYGEVVDSAGKVFAVKVSLADLSVTSFELGDHEEDDHNAGGHVVPSDQAPLFFWARHNKDTSLRYRIGSGGAGVLTFGSAQTITFSGNVTYAQAWRRPSTDEVHVFVRDGNRYWSNVYSGSWGGDWSSPRRIFDFGNTDLYYIATQAIEGDPSVLRVAAYGHPSSSSIHDIRAGLIDLDSGDVTTIAGTVLGNLKDGTGLPVTFAELDLVWDSPTDHTTRMYDVGGGDLFRIAFSDWHATNDTSSTYKLATLDGTWSTEDIAASGAAFYDDGGRRYYGGVTIPPGDDGTMLYLSREDSGTWYIERWLKDGTWSGTTLASDSDMLVRPWVPSRHLSVPVLYHSSTSYADVNFTASLEGERTLPSSLAGAPSAWPSLKP